MSAGGEYASSYLPTRSATLRRNSAIFRAGPQATNPTDLVAALRASVEEARKSRRTKKRTPKKKARKKAA